MVVLFTVATVRLPFLYSVCGCCKMNCCVQYCAEDLPEAVETSVGKLAVGGTPHAVI